MTNVIPTIGTPLPETEVTAEPDGELIVRGPQVTLGYYGLETDTIRDGVLRTGDLGVIHENGHITLKGRKKEMIVTAYGKNISIPKIEELLKSIPGVSEAVLIGEHRPYCTALLWLEGGATMARELQGRYQVTMLEAGGPFRPFSLPVRRLAGLRKTGLFLDERMIQPLLPAMKVAKTPDMVMVWGQGVGGTTTLATGNAVRCDAALKDIGIDLDAQFDALQRELPITTAHQARWTDCTRAMWTAFDRMGLNPVVTPKLLDAAKCVGCGHCAIGSPTGAKWDTRALVDQAVAAGAELVTGCRVTGLEIDGNRVRSVHARRGGRSVRYTADLVVLAAGGLGTPVILEKSGIPCEKTLFVDPVLCVAGPLAGFGQDHQLLMPFISQQKGDILSPYMDYLSFFFNRDWRLPMRDIASVMIKLADDEAGGVDARAIDKRMTQRDHAAMQRAVEQCREILRQLGVPEEKQFLGTLNAGHPGGMLPLTEAARETMHDPRLPENLYVADTTILPKAMGNPPILTIMALAKKMASML